jgi:signal peptidase I
MTTIVKFITEWIYSLVVAAALALAINIFLFQPTLVMGQSMEPTLHEGQRIYVSKVQHALHKLPGYGDIVVVDSRVNRTRTYKDDVSEPVINVASFLKGEASGQHVWVKRVIGLPGDEIEIKDGKVYRNGTVLTETYIKEPMKNAAAKKTKVPADHIFVLGDNRNNSGDSRYVGSIPSDHILGIMLF